MERPDRRPLIQVARPRLPDTAALVPYLQEIDANRWYANHGPLAARLEARLAARFGVPADGVTLTASATAGLAVTIATAARAGARYCAVPGWTFAGTAHAVRNAGLIPWFVDIDARTWALTPDRLRAALANAPGPVAAAVPVVPFGAPFDLGVWEAFQAETGVPVVVDAAAAFDTLQPARVPAVVSLHATKVLGVGEGGAVLCRDPDPVRRAGRRPISASMARASPRSPAPTPR
jgi:dTDP-4-amino-4,6-dideoxygalactose transaminase